jgi:mono/diheme cytochrome c family protein
VKTRDFILILIAVAVVAVLLLRTDTADAPYPRPSPIADRPETVPSPKQIETAQDELPADASELAVEFGVGEIPDPPEKTEELLATGEKLYQTNCALCHGTEMAGDGDAGKVFDPAPTDLRSPEHYKYGHDSRSIYRVTAFGIEGTGMAPWDGILAPEDMWAISFYVESRVEHKASSSSSD